MDVEQIADGVQVRPQSVMFSFLGIHVLGAGVLVPTRGLIEVMARVGVTEEAVRTTVARMARRGLLERHRRGRQTYVGLTSRAAEVLQDGHARIWEQGAVDRTWDGTWTLIGFSLPEDRRAERTGLRSRLLWEGYGMLQHGLWVAPGARDVHVVLGELADNASVTVMTSRAAAVTSDADLLARAYDLDAVAERYRAFLERWRGDDPMPDCPDDLGRQLMLHTEWLKVVRDNPRLPVVLLPPDPVAEAAEARFRSLAARYEAVAARIAADVLDVVPA